MDPREVLRLLENLDIEKQKHPRGRQRSAWFEDLVAQALSHIFYLPYFNRNNDDSNKPHRVVWNGTPSPLDCAPSGIADAILYAHEFSCLIEPTLQKRPDQWARELLSSIRHYNSFIQERTLEKKDVYLLLVAPKIHDGIFESIKSEQRKGCNFVPIEVSTLTKMLETAILAFTIRHLDLRSFFIFNLIKHSKISSSINHFRETAIEYTTDWQEKVLKFEKNTFLAIRSYEAMKQILKGHRREHVATSEILPILEERPDYNKYTALIKEAITYKEIAGSLESESLGFRLTETFNHDVLFIPVPFVDYERRLSKKVEAVKQANG